MGLSRMYCRFLKRVGCHLARKSIPMCSPSPPLIHQLRDQHSAHFGTLTWDAVVVICSLRYGIATFSRGSHTSYQNSIHAQRGSPSRAVTNPSKQRHIRVHRRVPGRHSETPRRSTYHAICSLLGRIYFRNKRCYYFLVCFLCDDLSEHEQVGIEHLVVATAQFTPSAE